MNNIDINKLFNDKEKRILCFLAENETHPFSPWEIGKLFGLKTVEAYDITSSWTDSEIVDAKYDPNGVISNVQIAKKGKEYVALFQEAA